MKMKSILLGLTIGMLSLQSLAFAESYTQIQMITSPLPGSYLPNSGTGPNPIFVGDGFGAAVSYDKGNLLIAAQDVTVDDVNDAGALCFYQKKDKKCKKGKQFQPSLTYESKTKYY